MLRPLTTFCLGLIIYFSDKISMCVAEKIIYLSHHHIFMGCEPQICWYQANQT
jgi:hypothetical protein